MKRVRTANSLVRPSPPVEGGCAHRPPGRESRGSCALIFVPPMSMGGAGLARPEFTRKFVVGLFYGGAFHDAAFTRMDGCDVVRLYDRELRMRKVARSFFPEEGVMRDMDIRAGNVGVLEADIGSAVAVLKHTSSVPDAPLLSVPDAASMFDWVSRTRYSAPSHPSPTESSMTIEKHVVVPPSSFSENKRRATEDTLRASSRVVSARTPPPPMSEKLRPLALASKNARATSSATCSSAENAWHAMRTFPSHVTIDLACKTRLACASSNSRIAERV